MWASLVELGLCLHPRNAKSVSQLIASSKASRSVFVPPLKGTEGFIFLFVSIKFNFKTPGLVLPVYIFPLISCSFHDFLASAPANRHFALQSLMDLCSSCIRPANVIPSGMAFHLPASGAAERAPADGTSAPGAFRSKAPALSRPWRF